MGADLTNSKGSLVRRAAGFLHYKPMDYKRRPWGASSELTSQSIMCSLTPEERLGVFATALKKSQRDAYNRKDKTFDPEKAVTTLEMGAMSLPEGTTMNQKIARLFIYKSVGVLLQNIRPEDRKNYLDTLCYVMDKAVKASRQSGEFRTDDALFGMLGQTRDNNGEFRFTGQLSEIADKIHLVLDFAIQVENALTYGEGENLALDDKS